jgi:hypothetical protein
MLQFHDQIDSQSQLLVAAIAGIDPASLLKWARHFAADSRRVSERT